MWPGKLLSLAKIMGRASASPGHGGGGVVSGVACFPATITSVLGKPPGAPSLQDQYRIDKQLGKGSFGPVRRDTGGVRSAQHIGKPLKGAKRFLTMSHT
jgi:hypothetical protein